MNRRVSVVLALVAASSLALAGSLYSQAQVDPASGEQRIEGTVQSIDAAKSVIAVRQTGHLNVVWSIGYDKDTAFSWRNEPAKVDEVKEGRQVICIGKVDETAKDKTHLKARRVEIRK